MVEILLSEVFFPHWLSVFSYDLHLSTILWISLCVFSYYISQIPIKSLSCNKIRFLTIFWFKNVLTTIVFCDSTSLLSPNIVRFYISWHDGYFKIGDWFQKHFILWLAISTASLHFLPKIIRFLSITCKLIYSFSI